MEYPTLGYSNYTHNNATLSILGVKGHIVLNVVTLLVFYLPILVLNGWTIPAVILEKSTKLAVRVSVVNVLFGGVVTAVGGCVWTLGLAATIGDTSRRPALEFTTRLGLYLFQVSYLGRSLALMNLSAVVSIVIRRGSKKIRSKYVIVGIAVQWLVLMVILIVRLPNETLDPPVYADVYYYLPYMKWYGRAIQLVVGIIVEVAAKITTFTFAILAFRHVRSNSKFIEESSNGPNKAMLRFLLIFVFTNIVTSFLSLTSMVGAAYAPDESFPVNTLLASAYIVNALTATATIFVNVMVMVQFKSTTQLLLRFFCCGCQVKGTTKKYASTPTLTSSSW